MKLARLILWSGLLATIALGWVAILTGGQLWGLGLFMGFGVGAVTVGGAVFAARVSGWK